MFSQFGEEKIINEIFGSNYIGTCIEIGAYDGVIGSNSKYYENNGWNCVCIEPNPDAFNKCLENRKKSICLNYAVSNVNEDNKKFTIYTVNGTNQSAISSLVVDDRLVESHKHMTNNVKEINVNIRTLDNILENECKNLTKIDFISIDTEGTELDILKGFDIEKWKPKLLLIENNYDENFLLEYLAKFGYVKKIRHFVNDFYVLE